MFYEGRIGEDEKKPQLRIYIYQFAGTLELVDLLPPLLALLLAPFVTVAGLEEFPIMEVMAAAIAAVVKFGSPVRELSVSINCGF